MLEVHCENRTILESLTARHLAAGEVAPRFHATSRPPYVEAEATTRAIALARRRGRAAVRRPPLVGRGARRGAPGPRRRPARVRRDVPALPGADRRAVRRCRPRMARPLRHLAAAARTGQPRRAVGRASPTARSALVATDHVPDRLAVEKQSWRESFDRISNGAPGHRDAARGGLRRGRRDGQDHRRAHGRPAVHDAGAAVRAAREGRDRGRTRRGPRAVRPGRAPDDPRRGPPPHERLHAVRGPRGPRARSGRRSSAARSSSATARSSGAAGSAGSWSASSSRCARRAGAAQSSRR